MLTHCARRAASRADWTAGSKQGDQDRDDRDDHQQLDQGKAATMRMAIKVGSCLRGHPEVRRVTRLKESLFTAQQSYVIVGLEYTHFRGCSMSNA